MHGHSSHTYDLSNIVTSDSSSGELLSEPFQCCILPDFIIDPTATSETAEVSKSDRAEFLHHLKDELLRLKFYEKNNDLYQFHQVILYSV